MPRSRPGIADLHLLIVGDGPGRHGLRNRPAVCCPGAYTFVGRIPAAEMSHFYQAGEVFAFPGINESLGMVYLEAQCCGLPVVATSHDGAPEVVTDKKTGLIVPPFSQTDFAGALFTLLTDTDLRDQYSRQARERVVDQHDMATNYRVMFARMEKICKRWQR